MNFPHRVTFRRVSPVFPPRGSSPHPPGKGFLVLAQPVWDMTELN